MYKSVHIISKPKWRCVVIDFGFIGKIICIHFLYLLLEFRHLRRNEGVLSSVHKPQSPKRSLIST
jgi:hypothetical protein